MIPVILIAGLLLFLIVMFSLMHTATPSERRQDDEDQIRYLEDYRKNHPNKHYRHG